MSRSRQRPTEETVRGLRLGLPVQEEYAALRSDPDAWADDLAEAESSHVTDGID